jgi:hypothetical protein
MLFVRGDGVILVRSECSTLAPQPIATSRASLLRLCLSAPLRGSEADPQISPTQQ